MVRFVRWHVRVFVLHSAKELAVGLCPLAVAGTGVGVAIVSCEEWGRTCHASLEGTSEEMVKLVAGCKPQVSLWTLPCLNKVCHHFERQQDHRQDRVLVPYQRHGDQTEPIFQGIDQ